jgi:Xaa-Pro aminopeptidase
MRKAMATREYNRDRLNQAMDELGIEAIIASSPWNVTYTSGVYLDVPQVTFLVTTRDGRQGLVTDEADAIFMRNDSEIKDIRDYPFCETTTAAAEIAVRVLADILQDLGLSGGRIGIEEDFVPASYQSQLEALLPQAKIVAGSWALNEARIYKMPSEIEMIRYAAYSTDRAIMTAFAYSRPGDTERDVANAMQYFVLRYGARTFSHTVCSSGVQGTVVHAHPLDRPIRNGEVIHVDFGGRFDGYSTDLSRNACVGTPTQRQKEFHYKLWDIEQLIFEHLKPGVVACEIFELAERAFTKVGLKYPWGTLGHSNGLLVHEGFEITRTSKRVIESGMVLNIEPTHIEPGDARYHIEDTVLVAENGVQILSNYYNAREMFTI